MIAYPRGIVNKGYVIFLHRCESEVFQIPQFATQVLSLFNTFTYRVLCIFIDLFVAIFMVKLITDF